MTLDSPVIFVIGLSLALSFLLAIALLRTEYNWRWKLTFLVVLIPPVIGPIFYLWIRYWPRRASESLQGRSGGLGRRFLDAELSNRHGGKTLEQGMRDDLAEEEKEWREVKAKARRRNRLKR